MTLSSGYWYAVLSSRELKRKPVSKKRFGKRLVFWRHSDGTPVCLLDRCPHRSARLSLGHVEHDNIVCKFHGFCFDREGACTRVPAEGNWVIPDELRVAAYRVRESQDFIWLWRGPAVSDDELPPVPQQPLFDDYTFGETSQIWPGHFSRCIEGVIDYSHLPFVHTRTLGVFRRDPLTEVKVDLIGDGFRLSLMKGSRVRHHIEFTYPSIWVQPLFAGYMMSATYAPIDDRHTEVYYRWHHRIRFPLLRPLVDLWGHMSFYMVFAEDMAVLKSQRPRDSMQASHEKLVPSDAGIITYRKMRKQHARNMSKI